MWYADNLLQDTSYSVIFATNNGKELFRGWIEGRSVDFEVSNNWGDPPSNPINSIISAVASSLNSAAMSSDSLKNSATHIAHETLNKIKDFGIIKEDFADKVSNAINNISTMGVNSGKIVIPAGEYYKTYQGTSFSTPRLQVSTVFICDTTYCSSLGELKVPGSENNNTLSTILKNLLPNAGESGNDGSGLFIQMEAPGGYSMPTNLTADVTGAYKIVWGYGNNPKSLKNLLVENISISKSTTLCYINDNTSIPSYVRLTLSLIPARAYTRDKFVDSVINGV